MRRIGSAGKKKTTMAKLARETRLRERRLGKQAKKAARKHASADGLEDGVNPVEGLVLGSDAIAMSADPESTAIQPPPAVEGSPVSQARVDTDVNPAAL